MSYSLPKQCHQLGTKYSKHEPVGDISSKPQQVAHSLPHSTHCWPGSVSVPGHSLNTLIHVTPSASEWGLFCTSTTEAKGAGPLTRRG